MNFPYKKALVTGGAGFIGSHLVKKLLSMGLEVVSVDNYMAGSKENLEGCQGPAFNEVNCDITDFENLKKCFDGVDIVFHNAASKKTVCLNDPRMDLDINAKGTFNLLELSRERGVKKFVHGSTGSVYGEALYFPQDEKHPVAPTSYYGVSKLAGEKYVTAFATLYGMNVSILRYFHVYGTHQDDGDFGGVVAIFSKKARRNETIPIFGDGTQMRSFTFVGDVVNANIFVAGTEEARGEAFNCASGIKVTIQELAEKIRDISGKKDLPIEYSDWTPGDIKVFNIDNSKLKNLGFSFKQEFEEGLRDTFNWYNNR